MADITRQPLYISSFLRGPRRAIALYTHLNPGNTGEGVGPPFLTPLEQTDWPNPRRRVYSPELYNWEKSSLPLTETWGPVRQTDWPNPRGPQFPIVLRTWVKSTLPLRESITDVARPWDWPNPRIRVRLDFSFTGGKAPEVEAAVEQTAPASIQWTNPWGRRRVDYSFFGSKTAEAAPVVAAAVPFAQLDWPNPRGRTLPVALRTWTQLPVNEPIVVVPAFPRAAQWDANPVRRVDQRYRWEQIINVALVEPPPEPEPEPARPTSVKNWPDPCRYLRRRERGLEQAKRGLERLEQEQRRKEAQLAEAAAKEAAALEAAQAAQTGRQTQLAAQRATRLAQQQAAIQAALAQIAARVVEARENVVRAEAMLRFVQELDDEEAITLLLLN